MSAAGPLARFRVLGLQLIVWAQKVCCCMRRKRGASCVRLFGGDFYYSNSKFPILDSKIAD